MPPRWRLGENVGQRRKLFDTRRPAVSFLSQGQKRANARALKRPNGSKIGKFAALMLAARRESLRVALPVRISTGQKWCKSFVNEEIVAGGFVIADAYALAAACLNPDISGSRPFRRVSR